MTSPHLSSLAFTFTFTPSFASATSFQVLPSSSPHPKTRCLAWDTHWKIVHDVFKYLVTLGQHRLIDLTEKAMNLCLDVVLDGHEGPDFLSEHVGFEYIGADGVFGAVLWVLL